MTTWIKTSLTLAALIVLGVLLVRNHKSSQPVSSVSATPPASKEVAQEKQAPSKIEISKTETSKAEVSKADKLKPAANSVQTTNALAPAAQTTLKPAEIEKAPEPTCFIATYHHKPLPSHNDEEACSHHKNLIHLSLDNRKINPQSVCVRVNNTPVKFEKVKMDEFMIGAIAGPSSKITVRYCVAKTACAEDCTIPKDEFMDAIGGSEEEAADARDPKTPKTKWDPNDQEDDKSAEVDEVQRSLADVENSDANHSIFKDWIVDSKTPVCGAGKS